MYVVCCANSMFCAQGGKAEKKDASTIWVDYKPTKLKYVKRFADLRKPYKENHNSEAYKAHIPDFHRPPY